MDRIYGELNLQKHTNRSAMEAMLHSVNLTMEDWDYLDSYNPSKSQAPNYCGQGLVNFRTEYKIYHGYISLIVCLLGCVSNVLNIIVLTRKEMHTATNVILTGLAAADFLVMLEYIPFTFHYYIFNDRTDANFWSYGWAIYIMIHANFSQIFHTISIGLTVSIAVWRYFSVGVGANANWYNLYYALLTVVSIYVMSPVLSIPVFISFSIQEYVKHNEIGEVWIKYKVEVSELATDGNYFLVYLNFIIYSFFIKLIPCLILTVFCFRLVDMLVKIKRRKIDLSKNNNVPGGIETPSTCACINTADQTTIMLLSVLFLFLLTELPQAILALLSVINGIEFFKNCYHNLSEVMDILALVNCSINFVLFCSMSSTFRRTFRNLFIRRTDNNVVHMAENPRPVIDTMVGSHFTEATTVM